MKNIYFLYFLKLFCRIAFSLVVYVDNESTDNFLDTYNDFDSLFQNISNLKNYSSINILVKRREEPYSLKINAILEQMPLVNFSSIDNEMFSLSISSKLSLIETSLAFKNCKFILNNDVSQIEDNQDNIGAFLNINSNSSLRLEVNYFYFL